MLAGDRWLHLRHLLADWVFARDLARGARPELDARIERFAQEIIAARHRQDVDEVALVGHSLGMVLLCEALATALTREPQVPGPRLALVGLGSSVLKIALMPQARRLRDAVARIAVAPGLAWMEFTSRRDLVCFHRADPVAVLAWPGRGRASSASIRAPCSRTPPGAGCGGRCCAPTASTSPAAAGGISTIGG